ncbi:MAG: MgtC/SapB family protein [Chloroflexi bacterium]|nr:MgtC/SapB family protein [Chloroflexota bacterium]
MQFWEMIMRLVLSALLGALIGLERETHGRPAGLRTHILVCLGATLFTVCSYMIAGSSNDPGRVTAQIVTGIGFLGAGTIIHQGSVVRGLTTAASVWTVAAIGVAVGIGGQALYLAGAASIIVFGTLNLVPRIERRILTRPDERTVVVTTSGTHEDIGNVISIMTRHHSQVRSLSHEDTEDGLTHVLTVRMRVGRDFDQDALSKDLLSTQGVIAYRWD